MSYRFPEYSPDVFDLDCQRCGRLVEFLNDVKGKYPDYHCRPVPPFGDSSARLLIVGLAPGMHGANATGRPFTGDHAGILLYRTLYRFGFSNCEHSRSSDDDLQLKDCRITNAVKCLPPANKPILQEMHACNRFLAAEIKSSVSLKIILALGRIAHISVLKSLDLKQSQFAFAHNACYELPKNIVLVDSYHCSRYNTQTGRLTEGSFAAVFDQIKSILSLSQ